MDLAIHISPDRLQAILDLPAGSYLEPPMLKVLLSKMDICSGLQRDGLMAATVAESDDRSLLLAVGQPPRPGRPGRFDPPLSDRDLSRAVKAGDLVGTWLPPEPGQEGQGVDGTALFADTGLTGIRPGPGLAVIEGGHVVVLRDGALTAGADGELLVIVPGLSERPMRDVVVTVDAQALEARLYLAIGEFAPREALIAALARAQVAHGLDVMSVAQAGCGVAFPRDLVLARATPSIAGVDAHLELLVDEHVHFRVNDFDRVDYHEIGKAREVKPGMPLARLHAGSAGQVGRDVHGREIPTRTGRDLDLNALCGEGTRVSDRSPLTIDAAVAGVYRRTRGGVFHVQPLLTINGDVDLKSGNIDTELPVVVTGDVKAGFSLKSGADVVVMGVIEDARVSVRGNLAVRGGILPGRLRVKAHGNLIARYITGREVKGRDIEVAGSVRHSRVLATASVTAKEIVAGRLIAGGSLTCETLGGTDEQRTQVQVGSDPYEAALFLVAQQEQGRHAREVVRLKERCKLLAHKLNQRGAVIEGQEDPIAEDLRQALSEFASACTHLAECETVISRHDDQLMDANHQAGEATVTVTRTAHVGVEVLIGELARIELHETLQAPTFRHKGGAVMWG